MHTHTHTHSHKSTGLWKPGKGTSLSLSLASLLRKTVTETFLALAMSALGGRRKRSRQGPRDPASETDQTKLQAQKKIGH